MKIVSISEAKTKLSELIAQVCQGEEVLITRSGKPVARLVAVMDAKQDRQPGALRGKIKIGPEFFDPLSEAELKSWE